MELLSFVVVEKLFVLVLLLVLVFVLALVLLLLLIEVRDEVEEVEEEVVNVRILDGVCILCILYCVKISYLS